MRISTHWNTKRPRETEICQFQIVSLVNQQILRLQVTMEDTVGVAVQQARIKLVSEFLFDCFNECSYEKRRKEKSEGSAETRRAN